MNKLEIINESISEIRDILGAECANIEDLPEMVKQLADDPARSGFTTAFVFSSESSPIRPEGGKLNAETGLVEDLEPSWSQKVERATTFSLRAIPEPTTNWMSFAIFNPSGEKVTEWSDPVNLKGVQGEQGIPGEAGATGPQGPAGPKGDSSNSYRTVSVYATTEDTTAPSKPIGGRWDLATNTVTPPSTTNDKYKWYLNADEPPKNNYLWMSQATFGESGDLINAWCEPFRLTGEAGKSGADGRVTEFIYRLLPDLETYNELSKHLTLNKLYSPEYEDDKVPSVNDDLNIGTTWIDQPKGITETMQIEVCCTRTRKGVDQPWSEWSNCIIWSKWGEDGMDGDGVEYIYLVTPDTLNGEPMTSKMVSNLFMPDRDKAMKHEYYQQDEFCFNGNWAEEYKGYDWTDEPSDVGPGEPLEWVSVRKKRKNEKGIVEWGRFSDPAIWGRFAEDGYAYKTSFVFTRSMEQPNRPTGGSFDDPKPIENNWYDSIPPISAANNIVGPVWMSSRTFYAGDESFDSDWTYPTIMADSQYFQVEYTHGNKFGLVPGIDPFTGDEDAWRKNQLSKYQIQWGDDDKINDPIWMATATCDNGVWSNWVVTRIKGEKGDKGENGSSVKIKHKFTDLDAIKAEWDRYLSTGYFLNDKLDTGDGFYAEDTGLLWVYSGGYDGTEEDTDFDLYWQGVALKGEPGDSAYLYTAFAKAEGGPINFVAGKWIGVRASNKALDPDLLKQWSTYTWTKWQGEDGWGQEQVFLLTSKNANFDPANGIEPPLPTNEDPEYKEAGYLPLHNLGELAKGEGADRWADSPLTVSEEWPYCWVVSRKMQGKTFGPWKGDSDGDGAALYSRYSYDGLDGKSPIAINLTNDLVVIPMEDDLVDPDFIIACTNNPITTGVQVFIGDDLVDNEDYDVVKSDYFTVNNEKDTLTLNVEKVGDIKEIPVTVTVGSNEYKTTWKILKTDTAYELEPSLHVIKRYSEGANAGSLENSQFTVKVWKWSDDKWIASGKALFAKVSRGASEKVYSNKDNSGVVSPTTNGVVTVNLSGIKDITGVRLFVTSDDIGNESNTLSFEDIAIVADGVTGPQGPRGLAGLDANASFKSTAFRRGEGPFNAPEGGDYNSPKPTTEGWFESIPDGTALLWASTRIFSSDGKYPQESKWSEPAKMTDTADFDVEFSSTINPGNPTSNPENWSNSSDTSTIWMAVRKAKNGIWGEWQVSKIKGEDGADGHSINMKGTVSELPEAGTVVGEGYNVNGILYIWDGDSWVDCGKIKGESGASSFIHVKYASEVTTNNEGYGITGNFTESDGEEPGKYMGVYVDDVEDDVLDITKYKWTKAEGEDGFGYEYIYQRTNSDVAPDVPTDITEDDVAPINWTDSPSGVTSTEMYEWVCYRKKISGVWTKWIGAYSDPAKAALWAKWGETGPAGEITEEEKAEIENAVRDAVLSTTNANITAAKNDLQGKLDTATATLDAAIKSGDNDAIAKANSAYTLAENAKNGLTTLETAVNSIGKEDSTILSLGDIQNLSIAALVKETEFTDDAVSAPTVFAQNVVSLAGTFAEVKAENITGTTISGKTVQSSTAISDDDSDPRWKLNDDGSGYLASKNISWNKDGSKVEFGENVTLSWSNISDADSKVSNAVNTQIDNKGFVTQSDIDNAIDNLPKGISEERVTEITRNTIETKELTATNLHVNAANIDGKLTADQIEVGEISTNVLKTYGSDNKGITIEGDDIIVRKNGSSTEIMRVSGDEGLSTIPERKTITIYNDSGSVGGSVTFPVEISKWYEYDAGLKGSFEIDSNYQWSVEYSKPTIQASIEVGWTDNGTYTSEVGLQMYDVLLICSADIDRPAFDPWTDQPVGGNTIITVYGGTTASNTVSASNQRAVMYWTGNHWSEASNAVLPAGSYNYYRQMGASLGHVSSGGVTHLTYGNSTSFSLILKPTFETVLINASGIQYVGSDNTYFSVKKSGTMVMRNGSNAFGIDATGPFFVVSNKKYYFTGRASNNSDNWITGTSGTTIDWSNYQ